MTRKKKIMVESNNRKIVVSGNFDVEEDVGATLTLKDGETVVGSFDDWGYWLDLTKVKVEMVKDE